jgi:predicted acetyltransferase
MTQVIRPIDAPEWPAAEQCLSTAFGSDPFPPERMQLLLAEIEWDRTLCTFDGEQLVGTAGAISMTVTVPGAIVPMAGVSMVSVLPSHRRRGVLTRVMQRQLTEVREAGIESISLLWASEAAIYQRYGYGCASWQGAVTVRCGSAFGPGGAATLARHQAPLALVPEDRGVALAREVLAAHAAEHPGTIGRSPATWAELEADLPSARGGATATRWVVTEGGFAHYRQRAQQGSDALPGGTVELGELLANTPEAYAALWRFVLDLDLMSTVVSPLRPAQDPLLLLVADPRRVGLTVKEGLWVRLVDLPRALQERSYAAPCSLILRVHDDVLAANDGLWRVEVDALGAASVTRTTGPADLELDVADLGAAHLGSTSLTWLAQAGRVREHSEGALRTAARAWSWDVPASGTEVF